MGVLFSLVCALEFPGAAQAEVQRVEAVGIYGIKNSMRSRVIPRDEAIGRGIWEGVSRVALELMGESSVDRADASYGDSDGDDGIVPPIDRQSGAAPGADARRDQDAPNVDEVKLLESALGKDMLPYTRSFRILKDQGEKPVLFADDPAIKTEYVVVVEVIVDTDRVTQALENAGLITSLTAAASAEAVTLEIVGLSQYAAVSATLEALRGRLGATTVDVVEFGRGVQILSVRGPFGADGLSDRLAGVRDASLRFDPVSVDRDGRRLRVRGHWTPDTLPN